MHLEKELLRYIIFPHSFSFTAHANTHPFLYQELYSQVINKLYGTRYKEDFVSSSLNTLSRDKTTCNTTKMTYTSLYDFVESS